MSCNPATAGCLPHQLNRGSLLTAQLHIHYCNIANKRRGYPALHTDISGQRPSSVLVCIPAESLDTQKTFDTPWGAGVCSLVCNKQKTNDNLTNSMENRQHLKWLQLHSNLTDPNQLWRTPGAHTVLAAL